MSRYSSPGYSAAELTAAVRERGREAVSWLMAGEDAGPPPGLVVDPNIVESTFRLHFTTSIAAHSTEGYIEALKLCLGEEAREETDGRAEVV